MNKDLKVIKSELVPVYETSTGEKVVYGTELYAHLGSKRQYSDWIKSRFAECDVIEDTDYQSFSQNNEKPTGGRPKLEYIIKLDTAKEMAMLERNEKGKQVRRYFIQIEKKYKEQKKQSSAIEQLQMQRDAILEVNEKVGNVEQRVDDVKKDLEEFKQELPLFGVDEDRITTAVHSMGVKVLGGKDSNAYNDKSLRGKLYSDIYRELKRQFGITGTYKQLKRSQCDTAVAIVNSYQPPLVLAERIKDCNAQINMEVA